MADLIIRATDIEAVINGLYYWNGNANFTVQFNASMSYHELTINKLGPDSINSELNEFCGAIIDCFDDAIILASVVQYNRIRDLLKPEFIIDDGNIINTETGEVLKTRLGIIEY